MPELQDCVSSLSQLMSDWKASFPDHMGSQCSKRTSSTSLKLSARPIRLGHALKQDMLMQSNHGPNALIVLTERPPLRSDILNEVCKPWIWTPSPMEWCCIPMLELTTLIVSICGDAAPVRTVPRGASSEFSSPTTRLTANTMRSKFSYKRLRFASLLDLILALVTAVARSPTKFQTLAARERIHRQNYINLPFISR